RGILRKEAVAGMDGLCAAGPGGLDQLVCAQVAVGRLGTAEVDADVGLPGMPGVGVDRAVYRDGGQAHGLGGAHHSASDFAAVGDQQGGQHCRGSCVAWEVVPLTPAPSPAGGGDDGGGGGDGGIVRLAGSTAVVGKRAVPWVPRVGMTKTLHEPTPSPLWGEGWGERANGQPTSAIRQLLPARLALLQKGFQPLLALGADANAGDAVLGVTAQRLAERSAADLAQQI